MKPFVETTSDNNDNNNGGSSIVVVDLINNLLAPTQPSFSSLSSSSEDGVIIKTEQQETSPVFVLLNGPRGRFIIGDIITSILALIGNLLLLSALRRTRLAVTGYRRFLMSLLAADIFMATTVMLAVSHQYFANSIRSLALEQCGNVLLRSLTLVSYFASLLSIAGLTVDNFIGVFFELRYRNMMAGRRLTLAVVFIWLLSFLLGFADPLVAISNHGIAKIRDYSSSSTKNNNNALSSLMSPPSLPALDVMNDNQDTDLSFEAISDLEEDIFFKQPAAPTKQPALQEIQFIRNEDVLEENEDFVPTVEPEQQDLQLRDLITDVLNLVEMQRNDHQFCRIFRGGAEKFGVEFFVIGLTIPCFVLILVIYYCIIVKVIRRKRFGSVVNRRRRSLMRLTQTLSPATNYGGVHTSVATTCSSTVSNNQIPSPSFYSGTSSRCHMSVATCSSNQTMTSPSPRPSYNYHGGTNKNRVHTSIFTTCSSTVTNNQQNNNVRLALTTLMLISSFAFCWMSFITFELFVFIRSRLEQQQATESSSSSPTSNNNNNDDSSSTIFRMMDKNETLLLVNSIFNSLLMLSPLLNPIIYAARLKRVRNQLIQMMTCNYYGRTFRNYYSIRHFCTVAARTSSLMTNNGQPSSPNKLLEPSTPSLIYSSPISPQQKNVFKFDRSILRRNGIFEDFF